MEVGERDYLSRIKYCAKASKSERNAGCENLEAKHVRRDNGQPYGMNTCKFRPDGSKRKEVPPKKNNHPTVKPLKLMEYLCALTETPTKGIVLDPFGGSGTTAIACERLNRKWIGIEKEEKYCEISAKRIEQEISQLKLPFK